MMLLLPVHRPFMTPTGNVLLRVQSTLSQPKQTTQNTVSNSVLDVQRAGNQAEQSRSDAKRSRAERGLLANKQMHPNALRCACGTECSDEQVTISNSQHLPMDGII